MRHILSPRYLPILKKFGAQNVLLAFDFDGTLSPITAEPRRAEIRRSTRKLLKTLASRYPCIIVSGRSRLDVQQRVRDIGFEEVIGNHGIEPWESSRSLARTVRTWMPHLRESLKSLPEIVIEDKRFSVSIHYRKARRKRLAASRIKRAARTLAGAKCIGGKQVINIVPAGAMDKGAAVETARRRGHFDTVVYVGDDETDENAFGFAHSGRFLTIRVGAKRSSLAAFYIREQGEIDGLLRELITLRT